MYDEDNKWLLLMSNVVNFKKHRLIDLQAGKTLSVKLKNGKIHCTMNTQEVVNRSCREVFYLVKELVEISLSVTNTQ